MDRRFLYPGLPESQTPSNAVFRTMDLEDRSLPYRELRANDHSSFQHPHQVATDLYSAQPMIRSQSAVPWWTSIGLGLRPVGGDLLTERNENLEAKLSKYYNEDGLINDSGLPATDKNSRLIRKTTEPQLWRKISEPRLAILTEVNGKLEWREKNDASYDKSRTVTPSAVPVQPAHLRSSIPIGRTPYMVYT